MRLTLLLGRTACVIAALLTFLAPDAHAQLARVGWTAIVSSKSGQCLDIAGQSLNAGTAAVQWPCAFAGNEEWTVTPAAGGVFIIEQETQFCLTASGGSVFQGTCGAAGSVWTVIGTGNAHKLQSAGTSQCLTPANDNDNFALMSLASCADRNVSSWVFQSGLVLPAQTATLQAGHSGQCLMVAAKGAPHPGAVQNPCAGIAAERWRIVPVLGSGQYNLAYGKMGQCLTAASVAVGASLAPKACKGLATQGFSLQPGAQGYLLNVANTQLCVDVGGASLTPGSPALLASCATVLDQEWSVSLATVPASWTGIIPLNTDPIGVANLPDGTLLTWSAYDIWNYEADIGGNYGQTYYSTFTPATLTSGAATLTSVGSDMFCPGTANLADGRVLINGGSSSPKTTLFDPAAGAFVADAVMNVPRGYEGSTLLSTGSVFTLGGSWSGGQGGKYGEIWTSGQGWTKLSGVPEDNVVGPDPNGIYRGDNHLWLFATSGGNILQAGPSAQMNWISTAGAGTISSAGPRGDDGYSINGNAVMYDIGKILKAGGAPGYDNTPSTTAAYMIAVGAFGTPPSVTKIAPMAYPRGFSSGVALPNGQVLIVGGQTFDEPFTDTGAVLVPELWDPKTGVFRRLAPMQTPRTYHSTAILLNDGRVFVGGGGQCGYGCQQNHFNAEILTPPYLLNQNGTPAMRPVITAAPATGALGGTLSVSTNTPVATFSLMRNSSITHTVNNDQRRIPMIIQSAAVTGPSNNYSLTVPSDPGTVVPGYYMLFAIDPYGVPSVAASILIN